MVRDTPPYGHAPTYQISLTYRYLERQKCYGPDKKILFKKQLFDLEERQKSYGPDKLRWEAAEAEVEEKIRLKQYVSLRSKGRHNYKFKRKHCQHLFDN
jgi:ribosomal protein L21